MQHGEQPIAPLSPKDKGCDRENGIRNQKFARSIFGESKPLKGTIVEHYLLARGLDPAGIGFDELLFHPTCPHPSKKFLPAMIGPMRDASGKIVAIHRTYLKVDGSAKATIEPQKAMLGPARGAAIRFGAVGADIRVTEGIENAMAIREMLGFPAWAAGSATGIRQLDLPPEVRKLIIYADNDDNGVGIEAANDAARRFIREGRDARIVVPPRGTDVNDLLRHGAVRD